MDVAVTPPFLTRFQQEFPSLTSSGEHKNLTNTNAPVQASTEQRPSLRPQSKINIHTNKIVLSRVQRKMKLFFFLAETSWMQGGSRPQMPQGPGSVSGVSGPTLHSQTSLGNYIIVLVLFFIFKHCI